MVDAFKQYRQEVKEGVFPAEEHSYNISDEEFDKI
jgi:ketopantoate hydroxymethyltransferase